MEQDENNLIFVISYVIVDVKNKDNWKHFFTFSQEDLGDYNQEREYRKWHNNRVSMSLYECRQANKPKREKEGETKRNW
jgi:hypothetical protein